jgi:CPA2 family monovalent cation:H+ antiporter-2
VDSLLFQFALLVGVLGIAAIVSLSLRMPVVPLYIAAGAVLGIWLEPSELVKFLGSLGVAFLLFSMGLEFSIRSFTDAPGRLLRAGSADLVFNFPVGFIVGWLLGWTWLESLFLAGIVYMTSSAVVSKCIVDFGRAARPETETILGIMVFEDLVIAGLLVALGVLASGGGPPAGSWDLLWALGRAGLFVGFLVVLAWRFHESVETVLRARSEESFTLVLVAFVLLVASAALAAGLSEAIGAFLAGLVVGATPLKERASQTLRPFQTLFAALFFVSFGMALDLSHLGTVAGPAIMLVGLGLATKACGGFVGGRASGHSPRLSLVVGLSLIPKGEFSIVLAGLAAAVARPEAGIATLTGVYVFALSIFGPIAMREGDVIAGWLFRGRTRAESEKDSSSGSIPAEQENPMPEENVKTSKEAIPPAPPPSLPASTSEEPGHGPRNS